MVLQNNTLIHVVGVALVFIGVLGTVAALAVAMIVVGIYWAFEILFSVGWWASLLVMLVVAALYLTALFGGCKILQKGNNERI